MKLGFSFDTARFDFLFDNKYNRLKPVKLTGKNKHNKPTVECLCDCGQTTNVIITRLTSGHVKSCGCLAKETTSKIFTKDFTGLKVGRLTLLAFSHKNTENGKLYWHGICACGKPVVVFAPSVKKGHTLSCGCLKRDNTRKANITHGKSRTTAYNSWAGMLQRCYNPNSEKYVNYGARGIIVCPRWKDSFSNFYEDMGEKPKGLTLERKDVNGNYEPENCMWDDANEQAFNQTVRKDNLTGTVGVVWIENKQMWRAQIWKDKKHIVLGLFSKIADAITARREAELKYYGYYKG